MANAGSSSSSAVVGPTLYALQKALEEVSASIADFGRRHSQWHLYHLSCFPVIGNAWQDYQAEVGNHVGSIRGIRILRSAVQKELQWLGRHISEVGGQTTFSSSNAFFLSTSWQHVLYSALFQSPIVELEASLPLTPKGKGKTVKVDIICEGGKRWVRLSTIKAMSLLSEFRSGESYDLGNSDSSDDEFEETAAQSLDRIQKQLASGQPDEIANQCSLMKMARELHTAASIAANTSSWGRPVIELALTRLNFRDLTSSLQGKFYNDEERDRFAARVRAIIAEMEKMGFFISLKDQRELIKDVEQRSHLPSSFASGEVEASEGITPLPGLPSPPLTCLSKPTSLLNLDLSALVAMVSQITHLPASCVPELDNIDKLFRKTHWKNDTMLTEDIIEEQETRHEERDQNLQTQHTRTLGDQLRREMTDDCFLEAMVSHLQDGEHLQLVCTKEAKEKFFEILATVGGPSEQKRARFLFDENGGNHFWNGSKWEGNRKVRERIVLPVKSVANGAYETVSTHQAPSNAFLRLASNSAEEGLKDLRSASTTSSGGTGIQRQTAHTLASLLYGFQHGCSTLTTNIASIKWLVRDVLRCEAAEGSSKGYEASSVTPSSTAKTSTVLLYYPRSLAEKMMLPSSLPFHAVASGELIADTIGINGIARPNFLPSTSSHEKRLQVVRDSGSDTDDQKSSSTPALTQPITQFILSTTAPVPRGRLDSVQGCFRATRRWLQGPRPTSKLHIRHYRWWPLQPIEAAWMRRTRFLAWRDPAHTRRGILTADVETQGKNPHLRDGCYEYDVDDHDRWWKGVRADWRLNRLHWIALALTFIGWAFGFTFLVKDLWYEASVVSADGSRITPTFYGCTTTFWLANGNCGLDGQACAPFSSPDPVPFRCPASCGQTVLGGPRAVGDQLPAWVTLVVGGEAQGNSTSLGAQDTRAAATGPLIYRGDSFVCSAAIHAGVLSAQQGGCSSLYVSGAYSGYGSVKRNGITSTAFNTSFPLSYYFDTNVRGEKCTDRRYQGYILNVLLLAWVGFVLQPRAIVYFYTLVVVGFWHINFISEPRTYPMSIGGPMGDFLPTLFVAYALWRLTFRFVWPAFAAFPLERSVWIQGLFWIGVLLNVVFANVPLSRLVASDLTSQPGALTALIVIIVIIIVIAINQVRVIRKTGCLPKYLSLSIVGGIIVGLLAAIPTTGLRLHHYIYSMVLLLYCAFPTRLSLIYSSLLLGIFINGTGRWGYDGIIQDVATIIGSGTTGSAIPTFLAASNWTGVPGMGGPGNSTGIVQWNPIPEEHRSDWNAFALLIDDVMRLQSTQTSFNMSQLADLFLPSASDGAMTSTIIPPSNLTIFPGGNSTANVEQLISAQPHYLRLAYYSTNSGTLGDFTKAATVYFNGTFINPPPGAT